MLSLPYAGTRPCEPKVFLLLRALASPSTSAVVCACMAQGSWIVAQLPTACGNTVLQPSWRPSDGQQISWVLVPTCRATICIGARSTHTIRATERRLHFDSPTRTGVNSDSSFNDAYCFRLFSVDTSPSIYFSPFPSRTLPRSTRTMTQWQRPTSIVDLTAREPCRIFTFAKHVCFEHSTGIPCPVISSRRDGNINKRTKLKSFLTLDRRSVSPHRPASVRALRGQCSGRSGWRRDFP